MDDYSIWPLYVIILTWNDTDNTLACVDSLLAAESSNAHILVVDNGSTTDVISVLQARYAPQVRFISTDKNLGFAGGVNVGMRYALSQGAKSVLILNNDTRIEHAMLMELAQAAQDYPQVGILAPAIYKMDATDRIWRLGDRWPQYMPFPMRVSARNSAQAALSVDLVTGCAMLLRRRLIEKVGEFDERYFFYFEDADYCARARSQGESIMVIPHARMWHKVSASAGRVKPVVRFHRARGQALFYFTYARWPVRILTLVYLVIKTLALVLGDVVRGDIELARMSCKGTWEGYRLSLANATAE